MKRGTLLRFMLCISILTAMVLFTSCEKEKAEEGPVINPVDITISIDYPQAAELEDVENASFTIEENSSVMEALQLYCTVNEVPVTIEMTSGIVVGINDLLNGDVFANRTWQFELNEKLVSKPAGEVELKNGDHMKWVYIAP